MATIRTVLLFPTIIKPLVEVIVGATGAFIAPRRGCLQGRCEGEQRPGEDQA